MRFQPAGSHVKLDVIQEVIDNCLPCALCASASTHGERIRKAVIYATLPAVSSQCSKRQNP